MATLTAWVALIHPGAQPRKLRIPLDPGSYRATIGGPYDQIAADARCTVYATTDDSPNPAAAELLSANNVTVADVTGSILITGPLTDDGWGTPAPDWATARISGTL